MKLLAPHRCGFESGSNFGFFHVRAYNTSVVLLGCPSMPEIMYVVAPPVRLESCHITLKMLMWRKTTKPEKNHINGYYIIQTFKIIFSWKFKLNFSVDFINIEKKTFNGRSILMQCVRKHLKEDFFLFSNHVNVLSIAQILEICRQRSLQERQKNF